MAQINIDIPNEEINGAISDYVAIHPNIEVIANPNYVDEETTPEESVNIAAFTDAAWVKEHVRRFIKKQIFRGRTKKQQQAQETIVPPDYLT